jgi:hypothetical protein
MLCNSEHATVGTNNEIANGRSESRGERTKEKEKRKERKKKEIANPGLKGETDARGHFRERGKETKKRSRRGTRWMLDVADQRLEEGEGWVDRKRRDRRRGRRVEVDAGTG